MNNQTMNQAKSKTNQIQTTKKTKRSKETPESTKGIETKGIEKKFVNSFLRQLLLAREKEEKEMKKDEGKIKKIKPVSVAGIGSTIKRKEVLKRLKTLSIEAEKVKEMEKEKLPKLSPPTLIKKLPPPKAKIVAPIYGRQLPSLPKPPTVTKEWPMKPGVTEITETQETKLSLPPTPKPPKFLEAQAKAPVAIVPKQLKPSASILTTFDLGKINQFVEDNSISVIQCDGPGTKIKVAEIGRLKETNVILNEDEIKSIIQKFAARSNQPISKPIFKTEVGNLTITAIISEFVGSRFVISKS